MRAEATPARASARKSPMARNAVRWMAMDPPATTEFRGAIAGSNCRSFSNPSKLFWDPRIPGPDDAAAFITLRTNDGRYENHTVVESRPAAVRLEHRSRARYRGAAGSYSPGVCARHHGHAAAALRHQRHGHRNQWPPQ